MSGRYADWTRFGGKEIPSSLSLFDEAHQHLAALGPNEPVIDFGCGAGATCFGLHASGQRNIVGVDLNAGGIATARERRDASSISEAELEFVIGDLTQLPFEDDRFAFGILQAVLTAVPDVSDRARLLAEVARTLCPGAGLYLAVFGRTPETPLYRERYAQGRADGLPEGSFTVSAEDGTREYVAHHHTEDELRSLLHEAGMAVELLRHTPFSTRSGNVVDGMVVVARAPVRG